MCYFKTSSIFIQFLFLDFGTYKTHYSQNCLISVHENAAQVKKRFSRKIKNKLNNKKQLLSIELLKRLFSQMFQLYQQIYPWASSSCLIYFSKYALFFCAVTYGSHFSLERSKASIIDDLNNF